MYGLLSLIQSAFKFRLYIPGLAMIEGSQIVLCITLHTAHVHSLLISVVAIVNQVGKGVPVL